MNLLKNAFYLIYKLYYFTVFTLLFLALYPFLLIGIFLLKNNYFIYFLHRVWAFLLNLLTFISLEVRRENQVLPNQPLIIIANHTSFLDVFLMTKIVPNHPFVFMAKAELLKIPLFRTLFKFYHIPVFRKSRKKAAQAIVLSKVKLRSGLSVVIFPEGGIIDGLAPKMAHFKNGAFELAKDQKVAILPITYLNNFKLLESRDKFLSVSRPGKAYAVVHPLISVDEVMKLSVQELKQKCYDTINQPLVERWQ